MDDNTFFYWLMFLLFFALLPIKPLFQFFLNKRDTSPCVREENFHEWHDSQLYRPGDKKFEQIIRLESKAKKIEI